MTMEREESIKVLQHCGSEIYCQHYIKTRNCYGCNRREALNMAIEALHREEAEERGYCHRIIPSNVEVVVRCKDCKNWRESHSEDDESYCYIDGRTTDSTDYCSWGELAEQTERREE